VHHFNVLIRISKTRYSTNRKQYTAALKLLHSAHIGSVAEKVECHTAAVNTIERSLFNSYLRRVVASLDKTLYDNYLCLVVLNKQQTNWEEVKYRVSMSLFCLSHNLVYLLYLCPSLDIN